jgi:hypothetical protein
MNKYNLRNQKERKPPQKYNNSDYINYENINKDQRFRLENPYNPVNVVPLYKLKDYKLPPLKKKYSRPYFSPFHGSWEMDFMIVPYDYKDPSFIYAPLITDNTRFNYLFIVNINTKYLFVFPCFNRKTEVVIDALNKVLSKYKINNIRGDDDTAFNIYLKDWLKKNKIKYYFTPNKYTNRNRIVDRVMRTIRDIFDQLGTKANIINTELMKRIVDRYNHTTHLAFGNKYSPIQVQKNPLIEKIYIESKQEQLKKIKFPEHYLEGDVLLVYIPFEKDMLNYKRRRNFTHLAEFVSYDHGNVKCRPFKPFITKPSEIVLPIYHTKLACRNNKNKNNVYSNYF